MRIPQWGDISGACLLDYVPNVVQLLTSKVLCLSACVCVGGGGVGRAFLKASLNGFDKNTEVLGPPGRRGQVSKDAVLFEQNRVAEARWKHELRSKATYMPPAQGDHTCSDCDIAFSAGVSCDYFLRKSPET